MKFIKHTIIGVLLFSLSFALIFLSSDKTEYYIASYRVQEPRVYVTEHGVCYHAYDCHYLRQSALEKGMCRAESEGYRACSYCGGTPNGVIDEAYYKKEMEDATDKVYKKSFSCACAVLTLYFSVCVATHIIRRIKICRL